MPPRQVSAPPAPFIHPNVWKMVCRATTQFAPLSRLAPAIQADPNPWPGRRCGSTGLPAEEGPTPGGGGRAAFPGGADFWVNHSFGADRFFLRGAVVRAFELPPPPSGAFSYSPGAGCYGQAEGNKIFDPPPGGIGQPR